jgi:AraC-like DNA-binding protein
MSTTQSPPRHLPSMSRSTTTCQRPETNDDAAFQDRVRDAVISRVERPLSDRLVALLPNAVCVPRSARLIDIAREGDVRLVIGDPGSDGGLCLDTLLRIRGECPSVMIVIYTMLRAAIVPSLLELARCGVTDVVLYRTDDSRARFAELVDRAMTRPLTSPLIELMQKPLAGIPASLLAAIVSMFESPRRVRTVDDLAAVAHMTRRSTYRHLTAAGIRSPRLLVAAARLTRAASLLSQSGRTVHEVSTALGYSKPELLTAQLRTLTGLRPRHLRDAAIVAQVPEMIATRLVQP